MTNTIKLMAICSLFGTIATGCKTTNSDLMLNAAVKNTPPQQAVKSLTDFDVATTTFYQLRQDIGLGDSSLKHKSNEVIINDIIEFSHDIASYLNQPPKVERVLLEQAILSKKLLAVIDNIMPQSVQVVALRDKVRDYKNLQQQPWPKLPVTDYRLGQSADDISQIRQRLVILGDLSERKNPIYRQRIFDPTLIAGIKTFQQRHGLKVSGQLTQATTNALNITPAMRVKQMQLNLLRWAKLSKLPPSRYLWVNIPDYSLKIFEQQQLLLNMPVIVGKPKTPTPSLFTSLTSITVNPTWTVPYSIANFEYLPRHARQPSFLATQGFELHQGSRVRPQVLAIPSSQSQLRTLLTQYRLVQVAGHKNALGKFRFAITNPYSIFLHDTPAKYLFAKQQRALSHGCIRLKNSPWLSRYLLADQWHDQSKAGRFMRELKTQTVRLTTPMAVYVTYHTSWVDELGRLQFRPDIYHLDQGDK